MNLFINMPKYELPTDNAMIDSWGDNDKYMRTSTRGFQKSR